MIFSLTENFYSSKYEKFIETKQFKTIYEVLNKDERLDAKYKDWTHQAY